MAVPLLQAELVGQLLRQRQDPQALLLVDLVRSFLPILFPTGGVSALDVFRREHVWPRLVVELEVLSGVRESYLPHWLTADRATAGLLAGCLRQVGLLKKSLSTDQVFALERVMPLLVAALFLSTASVQFDSEEATSTDPLPRDLVQKLACTLIVVGRTMMLSCSSPSERQLRDLVPVNCVCAIGQALFGPLTQYWRKRFVLDIWTYSISTCLRDRERPIRDSLMEISVNKLMDRLPSYVVDSRLTPGLLSVSIGRLLTVCLGLTENGFFIGQVLMEFSAQLACAALRECPCGERATTLELLRMIANDLADVCTRPLSESEMLRMPSDWSACMQSMLRRRWASEQMCLLTGLCRVLAFCVSGMLTEVQFDHRSAGDLYVRMTGRERPHEQVFRQAYRMSLTLRQCAGMLCRLGVASRQRVDTRALLVDFLMRSSDERLAGVDLIAVGRVVDDQTPGGLFVCPTPVMELEVSRLLAEVSIEKPAKVKRQLDDWMTNLQDGWSVAPGLPDFTLEG